MEIWRSHIDTLDYVESSVYLFEGKTPVEKDFKILLEDFDNGRITGDELYECWHESMLYEHKLLNEGKFGDMMGRAGKAISGVFEKTKDWILQKSIQVWSMAKRGIEGAVKGAKVLIDKAADFKSEHPIAFKVATVVALSIAMFALMSALDADQAQAVIKAPAGLEGGLEPGPKGQISDQAYEALRGLVHQSKAEELGGTTLKFRTIAMDIVDKAAAAGEVVDFSTLKSEYGQFANEQLELLDTLVKMAREGDEQAFQWIKELAEIGEKVIYKAMGQPTRPIP